MKITLNELRNLVKQIIKEETNPKVIGNNMGVTKNFQSDGDGFINIRISSNTNIVSVKNKYLGGETESKKFALLSGEPQEGNTIGAYYYFKGTPNQNISISITGTNVNSKIDYVVKDADWNAYIFNFTNLPAGVFTINATNDSNNSLTVTVSESCDEEWKKLYEILENAADNSDIDLRPYYCKSKSMNARIKKEFPNIEESKVLCLIKKVNQQYCK